MAPSGTALVKHDCPAINELDGVSMDNMAAGCMPLSHHALYDDESDINAMFNKVALVPANHANMWSG